MSFRAAPVMAGERAGPGPVLPANRPHSSTSPTNHLPCSSVSGMPPTTQQTRRSAAPEGVAPGATSSGLPSSLSRGDPASPSRRGRWGPETLAVAASIRRLLRRPDNPKAAPVAVWPKPQQLNPSIALTRCSKLQERGARRRGGVSFHPRQAAARVRRRSQHSAHES